MSGRWSENIKWDGGNCPLRPNEPVNFIIRNGYYNTAQHAGDLMWSHHGEPDDIISYCYWIEDDKEQPAKQPRYLDSQGDDWIDEFARTATVDEFRGAMKFTIGKYLRRIGKKDDIPQELGKIRDYAERWKEYERERGTEN